MEPTMKMEIPEECENCPANNDCKIMAVGGEKAIFTQDEKDVVILMMIDLIKYMEKHEPTKEKSDEEVFSDVFDVMKAISVTGEKFMNMFVNAVERVEGSKGTSHEVSN
jgi:hypothetical protein